MCDPLKIQSIWKQACEWVRDGSNDKDQIYAKINFSHVPYRCKLKYIQLVLYPPKIEQNCMHTADNLNFPN